MLPDLLHRSLKTVNVTAEAMLNGQSLSHVLGFCSAVLTNVNIVN